MPVCIVYALLAHAARLHTRFAPNMRAPFAQMGLYILASLPPSSLG